MLGSATLAMVVSSTCMMVASMIDTVIMPACFTVLAGDAGPVAMTDSLLVLNVAGGGGVDTRPGECRADRGGQAARVTGIDFDIGAEARAERHVGRGLLDRQTDGHALDHLDPVAGSVLGGEQREFRAGAGADGLDRGVNLAAGISVQFEGRRL